MQEKTQILSGDSFFQVSPAPKSRAKGKKSGKAAADSADRLINQYFAIMGRLRSLEEFFQRTTDSELISACIYEMNSAQQQYAYILQRLKEEGVTYLKILR